MRTASNTTCLSTVRRQRRTRPTIGSPYVSRERRITGGLGRSIATALQPSTPSAAPEQPPRSNWIQYGMEAARAAFSATVGPAARGAATPPVLGRLPGTRPNATPTALDQSAGSPACARASHMQPPDTLTELALEGLWLPRRAQGCAAPRSRRTGWCPWRRRTSTFCRTAWSSPRPSYVRTWWHRPSMHNDCARSRRESGPVPVAITQDKQLDELELTVRSGIEVLALARKAAGPDLSATTTTVGGSLGTPPAHAGGRGGRSGLTTRQHRCGREGDRAEALPLFERAVTLLNHAFDIAEGLYHSLNQTMPLELINCTADGPPGWPSWLHRIGLTRRNLPLLLSGRGTVCRFDKVA